MEMERECEESKQVDYKIFDVPNMFNYIYIYIYI